MTPSQIRAIVNETLRQTGYLPKVISQAEAWRMYGKGTVKRWETEGIISFAKNDGKTSKRRYDPLELEIASATPNHLRKYTL